MPKISAPTVAEHRAHVHERLVDAAEELLRAGEPLTAAAVTQKAGLARNSVYRYVQSIEDLTRLVVERHLPGWVAAVEGATEGLAPDEAVVAWVQANLDQVERSGHRWFIQASRAGHFDSGMNRQAEPAHPAAACTHVAAEGSVLAEQADRAHSGIRRPLEEAWAELLGGAADRVDAAVALTSGLLGAGFDLLETDVPAQVVRTMTTDATRGLVQSLR